VFGNLIAVTLPTGTAITYIVDAENNRVAKKVNSVVVAGFLYDQGRLVAQLDSNNQMVSQFVYGSGGVSPDYMVAAGVTYRIFSDHHGSPRLVVNSATGQIVERVDYDEFGNVTNDTNPGFQPFGFAGGLYDEDTKLVRFGARDYDAGPGRWTSKDPLLFAGGDTNLYGYVLSDPINMIDPSGLSGGSCTCGKDVVEKVKQMMNNPDMKEAYVETSNNTGKIVKGTADLAFKPDNIGKAKGAWSIVQGFQKQLDVIDKAVKKFGTPKACPPIPHFPDVVVSTAPPAPEGMTPILKQYPNQ